MANLLRTVIIALALLAGGFRTVAMAQEVDSVECSQDGENSGDNSGC